MKYFTLLFLLLYCSSPNSESFIRWKSTNQLRWSQFKGNPDPKSSFYAFAYSGVNYEFEWVDYHTHLNISWNVFSYFNSDSSWVKDNKESDFLLKHEQGHFDITELYARKLNSKFSNFTFTLNYDHEFDSIFQTITKEKDIEQHLYDSLTDHSRNLKQQVKWNTYIEKTLQQFPNHEDSYHGSYVLPKTH